MDKFAPPLTLLIVDNELLIVDELSEFFESNGYTCIGCHSAHEARELFQDHPQIGIVLCDLHIPEQDGMRLVQDLERIAGHERAFEAIIFTDQTEPQGVIEAMRAGVVDYYQKPIDMANVLLAVKRLEHRLQKRMQDFRQLGQLNQRLQFLAESIDALYHDIHKMRHSYDKPQVAEEPEQDGTVPAPFDKLSPRQLEVARMVGKGLTNYQTACELGITENTVKLYVSQVLRLTHMNNRTQLALALAPPSKGISARVTAH